MSTRIHAGRKHYLIVSFPHMGHLIPTLELARHISIHHDATLVTSAYAVAELKKRQLIDVTVHNDHLDIVGIQDGLSAHGDVPHSNELVLNQIGVIERSYGEVLLRYVPLRHQAGKPASSAPVRKPVDMVIFERFVASLIPVCLSRGVPSAIFFTSGAAVRLDVPDQDHPGATKDLLATFFAKINGPLKLASVILINTFTEASEAALKALSDNQATVNTPVYCVGPLLPETGIQEENKENENQDGMLQWMDMQKPRSVVYISFGTASRIGEEQTSELLRAMQSLAVPFIFHVHGKDHKRSAGNHHHLQNGQAGNNGLLVPWCDQKRILAHRSCGMFISHCGWNSTLEASAAGVPVITWPLMADQYKNSEWLGKKGAAIQIPDTRCVEKGGRIVRAEELVEICRRARSEELKMRSNMELLQRKIGSVTANLGKAQLELDRFFAFNSGAATGGQCSY